GYNLGGGGID
uniref:Sperm-activating peptide (Tyr-2, Asn-3, Gly-5, Ile-9, Asp-10 SAP-I) n=1 Tax=Heterocentrotus mammillatus TaxID=31180 RepID=Q7M4B7_HETMA|nr:sperm-activating peptide I (2-Tyr,3-Asn,5-Gly,9-Ile,10-Asp) [Heterocentrotus mammillatus]